MSKLNPLFNVSSLRGVSHSHNNAFINSGLRLDYYRLMDIQEYEKLVSQDNIEDIIKILEDLYHYQIDLNVPIQENIKQDFNTFFTYIKKLKTPYSQVLKDYFLIPLDIFNLKLLTKGLLEQKDFQSLFFDQFGYLTLKNLKDLYEKKSLGFIPQYIKNVWKEYNIYLSKLINSYDLDLFWDKQLNTCYFKILKDLNSEILLALYKTQVDIKNIMTIFRLKLANKNTVDVINALLGHGHISKYSMSQIIEEEIDIIIEKLSCLPYNKEIKIGLDIFKQENKLSILEKYLTQYMMMQYHKILPQCINEDLIIIYYWLKQIEKNNLQILISGKTNQMSNQWILSGLKVVI